MTGVTSRMIIVSALLLAIAGAKAPALRATNTPALQTTPVAQGRGGRGGPPPTPRASAPVDFTGNWVSVVSEDWRWRMVTPPKNDVASVPLNGEGRKVAAAWDLDQDNAYGNQCRAFGAAGIMRQPLRVQISWQDDQTLKLDSDAGEQTRVFGFATPVATANVTSPIGPAERTWQGVSSAEWVKQAQSRGLGFGGRGLSAWREARLEPRLSSGYVHLPAGGGPDAGR